MHIKERRGENLEQKKRKKNRNKNKKEAWKEQKENRGKEKWEEEKKVERTGSIIGSLPKIKIKWKWNHIFFSITMYILHPSTFTKGPKIAKLVT